MKKLITLISLACVLFIGGTAPIIASEIDFERNQLFAANNDHTYLNFLEKSVVENSEDIEIEIQLNSGLGKDDWNTHQRLAAGAEFQYRVQISNFNGTKLQSDLLLSDIDPSCVKVRNAKIQNVSLEMSDHNFLIPACFLEYGEQLIIYVEAEYVGGEKKCASSMTISGASEDFSEFRIESNDVVLGRGGCEEVGVVISHSYKFHIDNYCCYELEVVNNFQLENSFNNLALSVDFAEGMAMTENYWHTTVSDDPLMYMFLHDSDEYYVPTTGTTPIKLATLCFEEDKFPEGVDFLWRFEDSVICITNLELDCSIISSSESFSSQQDLKVFPNPAHSLLNIQVERDMQNANAIIYSSEGKKVQATNLNFLNKTATLDIGNLAGGLYILQLQTEDGETEMIKFVKME